MSSINASFLEISMADLVLNFIFITEWETEISVEAKFEPIRDYEEHRYGERQVFYWHLISLRTTPLKDSLITEWKPSIEEYKQIEREAREKASKEAA